MAWSFLAIQIKGCDFMAKAIKTNVLRHLDALKIPHETREYTVDDDNFDGKLVAEKVDLPAEMFPFTFTANVVINES